MTDNNIGSSRNSKTKKAIAANDSKSRKAIDKALGPAADDFGKEIKPLGKEVGELTVRSVRSLLIKPLTKTVWGLEQAGNWISEKVSEKLSGIKEEDLREPDPRIALPTLQALIYTGDDEDIREIFAALLASDMNVATKSKVHPAFVELIKQMTQDEASMLKFISEQGPQIRYEVRLMQGEPGHFVTLGYRLSFTVGNQTPEKFEIMMVSLSNLVRLGLLTIDDNKIPINQKFKDWADKIKSNIQQQLNETERDKIELFENGIYLTPLSERFVEICLPRQETTLVPKPTKKEIDLPDSATKTT